MPIGEISRSEETSVVTSTALNAPHPHLSLLLSSLISLLYSDLFFPQNNHSSNSFRLSVAIKLFYLCTFCSSFK